MKLIISLAACAGLLLGCGTTDLQPASVAAVKVIRVIDGDTIELENKQRVRLLGVDTPERGCPGFTEATENMSSMVLSKRIVLVADGKQGVDRYGRLLRYIEVGGKDVGFEQIKDNLADARYDSEDGYPKHSRQNKYHKADKEENPKCQSK